MEDEELCYELVDYSVDELQPYFNEDIVPNFPFMIKGFVEKVSDCKSAMILSPEDEIEVSTIVNLVTSNKMFFENVKIGDSLMASCRYVGWEWLEYDKQRMAHFELLA